MAALIGMNDFAAGLGVGALAGVLGAPILWRWVGFHAWRAADREARLDQPLAADLWDPWTALEARSSEEPAPSR